MFSKVLYIMSAYIAQRYNISHGATKIVFPMLISEILGLPVDSVIFLLNVVIPRI